MALSARSPIAALALLAAMALPGCQRAAPPALTEADLRNTLGMDMVGKILPAQQVDQILNERADHCYNLHGVEQVFADDAKRIGGFRRALMWSGLGGGLAGWEAPGFLDNKPVDPATELRLKRASARAILDVAPSQHSAVAAWPARCTQTYSLGVPLYEGAFAFIAESSMCGGLCGGGHVIALEYRDGHWRVAGIRPTWIA